MPIHLLAQDNPLLTEQAEGMENLWNVFLYLAAAIGLLVVLLLAWVLIRYRRRANPVPSKRHEHIPIEIAYAVIPLLIIIGLFGLTVQNLQKVEALSATPDLTVKVTGFQWQWQFDYPQSGARSVGVGSNEPELVLPVNKKVHFDMVSADVIHSFWIPGFRYKRDLFPGRTTSFQVDIGDRTGTWRSGACAEYCGLKHDEMRFVLRIVTQEEFDRWLAQHPASAAPGGRNVPVPTTTGARP